MPAKNIDLFHMQDVKNNFNAMRPAPVCSDTTDQFVGLCQSVHISKNCYYGYQETKPVERVHESTDCEMKEIPLYTDNQINFSPKNGKRRCADLCNYPASKRLREEEQKKNMEPEINENSRLGTSAQDLLENLYWNLHGGHLFELSCVCD